MLTVRAAGGILFLALVAGVGAYAVYAWVVARLGAARASMAMYLVPVYAMAMGALLLGEHLRPYHGAAILLVFGGVGLATIQRQNGRLLGRLRRNTGLAVGRSTPAGA